MKPECFLVFFFTLTFPNKKGWGEIKDLTDLFMVKLSEPEHFANPFVRSHLQRWVQIISKTMLIMFALQSLDTVAKLVLFHSVHSVNISPTLSVTVHCHPVHADCLAQCNTVSLVYRLCMHDYVTNYMNVNLLCNPPQHLPSCLCALWLNHVAVQDESFTRSVSQPLLASPEGHLVTGCLVI